MEPVHLPSPKQRWIAEWLRSVFALNIHDLEGWGHVLGTTPDHIRAWTTLVGDTKPFLLVPPDLLDDIVAVLREGYKNTTRWGALVAPLLVAWDDKVASDREIADYVMLAKMAHLEMAIMAVDLNLRMKLLDELLDLVYVQYRHRAR